MHSRTTRCAGLHCAMTRPAPRLTWHGGRIALKTRQKVSLPIGHRPARSWEAEEQCMRPWCFMHPFQKHSHGFDKHNLVRLILQSYVMSSDLFPPDIELPTDPPAPNANDPVPARIQDVTSGVGSADTPPSTIGPDSPGVFTREAQTDGSQRTWLAPLHAGSHVFQCGTSQNSNASSLSQSPKATHSHTQDDSASSSSRTSLTSSQTSPNKKKPAPTEVESGSQGSTESDSETQSDSQDSTESDSQDFTESESETESSDTE